MRMVLNNMLKEGYKRMKTGLIGTFALLFLILIAITIFPVQAHASQEFEEGTVTGENVIVRLRPGKDSPEVCKLDIGTRIGIYYEEIDGWVRIIYGNYRGYIKREHVFIPHEDSFQANVYNDGLRLRLNPGTYSSIVAELEAGTPVTITDVFDDWYYLVIESEGLEGFAHKDFVRISTAEKASYLLKPGMSGSSVIKMQRELKNRGFFPDKCDGKYDDLTKSAVGSFQGAAKLSVDGIAGAETLNILYAKNDIKATASQSKGVMGSVIMAHWDTVKNKFVRGKVATVTDVKTGKQFQVKRYAGSLHADSDPVSAADTAIMKEIYGGSWSWDRRAIWVTVDGVTYAASMNGMPHSYNHLSGNNFSGHFCIHFYKSKGHTSGVECPIHQACVKYAYDKAR